MKSLYIFLEENTHRKLVKIKDDLKASNLRDAISMAIDIAFEQVTKTIDN